MKRIQILSMAYLYVLLVSFLPLLVKGMLHVQGGSYIPMLVINVLGLPILYGLYFAKPWVTFFIRAWSVWMMIYGIIRLLLQVLVKLAGSGVESGIANQVTFGFLCMSLAHIAAGWALYRYLYSCVWVADNEHQLAVQATQGKKQQVVQRPTVSIMSNGNKSFRQSLPETLP